MAIDYTKVIRDCVEPRLAYHGFRYNEQQSEPAAGFFRFTRQFFGKSQSVEVIRGRYLQEDLAGLLSEESDIPTEVPGEAVGVDEAGYVLWLSNRRVHAFTHHDNVSRAVCHGPIESDGACDWNYRTEADLRRVLKDMVEVVLAEGLDWFEEQAADIRRHHEKLDARRMAEKERRVGRDLHKG